MEAIRNSACATGPSATEEKEIEEKVRERRIDQEKKNEKSDATNPEKKEEKWRRVMKNVQEREPTIATTGVRWTNGEQRRCLQSFLIFYEVVAPSRSLGSYHRHFFHPLPP